MAEKSILCYFRSPEQAQGIASKLQALRATDVQIDRFSQYPSTTGMNGIRNPVIGTITSLATLTQNADVWEPGMGALIAADPAASGMSDSAYSDLIGVDIVLTATVDESVYNQAMRVIEEGGGMV